MIKSTRLLSKSKNFMLLSYVDTLNTTFYKIDLTIINRFNSNDELLNEYNSFFDQFSSKKHGRGWVFSNKDEAASLYNWAVIKWS